MTEENSMQALKFGFKQASASKLITVGGDVKTRTVCNKKLRQQKIWPYLICKTKADASPICQPISTRQDSANKENQSVCQRSVTKTGFYTTTATMQEQTATEKKIAKRKHKALVLQYTENLVDCLLKLNKSEHSDGDALRLINVMKITLTLFGLNKVFGIEAIQPFLSEILEVNEKIQILSNENISTINQLKKASPKIIANVVIRTANILLPKIKSD